MFTNGISPCSVTLYILEILLTGRFGAGFLAGGGASTPSSAISDIYYKKQ